MIFITNPKNSSAFKKILALFFWLMVWGVLSFFVKKEIILPSPLAVFLRLKVLVLEKTFWLSIFNSLLKIIFSYILALLVGGVLGIFCYFSKIFFTLINPVMSLIKATPVPSITMLFLFYIKSKNLPMIVAFIMVLPVIWQSTVAGLDSAKKDQIEMAKIFNLSFRDKILHVYVVSALPYFFSAMEIAVSLAFKAGISSEIVAFPINTIGRMINDSKVYLDSPSIFAWTGVVVFLSLLSEKLAKKTIRKLTANKIQRKENINEI